MTEHLIAVGRACVERTDFPPIQLHIADDFASRKAPLISPVLYERVFLPNLKRLVGAFHEMGFKVSYESEGNTWPMIEFLDEAQVDVLANMEPRDHGERTEGQNGSTPEACPNPLAELEKLALAAAAEATAAICKN